MRPGEPQPRSSSLVAEPRPSSSTPVSIEATPDQFQTRRAGHLLSSRDQRGRRRMISGFALRMEPGRNESAGANDCSLACGTCLSADTGLPADICWRYQLPWTKPANATGAAVEADAPSGRAPVAQLPLIVLVPSATRGSGDWAAAASGGSPLRAGIAAGAFTSRGLPLSTHFNHLSCRSERSL